MQISAEYNATMSTVCDRCGVANGTINGTCFASLQLGNNAACTGACGAQLATAVAACTATVSCKIAIHALCICNYIIAIYVATCVFL